MMGAVALTICLAVGCSLLISLTFIPLAAAHLAPRAEVTPGYVLRRLVPTYRRILDWTLDHRFITLSALLLFSASAAIPIIKIEKVGEPASPERAVTIRYNVVDDISLEVMEGYVNVVEQWLFGRKEELGFESVYTYFTEGGYGLTSVYLPPDRADPDAISGLRSGLREGMPVIPGVELEVGDRDRRRHGGGQDRRVVWVSLNGEDPEYLEELALDVEERLRPLEHVEEIWGPTLEGQKELRLLVSADAAHQVGVSPRTIAETVAFSFRGRRMRRFQGPSGEVEMWMGLPDDAQPGLDALADLAIPRLEGGTVPLSSVAEVTMARTNERLIRIDRKTTQRVAVQFDKDAVTTGEAMDMVKARMEGFAVPEGYEWDFGESGRHRDEALATMLRGVILSLMVVILLMAALFESITQPFAVVITLLTAFFGAFWSLWLFGFRLDAVAFMGVIILIGIVVNNGIVLADHVNSLRSEDMPRRQALITGCGDRMRPVLMTAITTIFGLIPLAVSQATVAGVYIDSIAVAVIGGLTTSTIFTLLALPVWYATLDDLFAAFLRSLPRRVAPRRNRAG
ncbi:MAG: efflux RND transporter permease subunit [bacterium]|nr:efflux RND transporter permease subunit [bacterium]